MKKRITRNMIRDALPHLCVVAQMTVPKMLDKRVPRCGVTYSTFKQLVEEWHLTTNGQTTTFTNTRALESAIRELSPNAAISVTTGTKTFNGYAKVALRTSRKHRQTINLWAVLANERP